MSTEKGCREVTVVEMSNTGENDGGVDDCLVAK